MLKFAPKTRILCYLIGLTQIQPVEGASPVSFVTDIDGSMNVAIHGTPIAKFVWKDDDIPRPYFSDVRTTNGIQVTRRHPPDREIDVADHPTFHPGIWLTFGDLSGADYWRVKAHANYSEKSLSLKNDRDSGTVSATFHYFSGSNPNQIVCEERLRCEFVPIGRDYLILWDSQFTSEEPIWFGDQEEMGLGVRVATSIRAESRNRGDIPPGTGTILDAEGRKNGGEVWGTSSDWCDYSGIIDSKHVGVTLICHSGNFRASWFHARDYGLLVANPFGRAAFHQGEPSRVEVAPGETFRLRYGIFVHARSDSNELDLNSVYQRYLELAGSTE